MKATKKIMKAIFLFEGCRLELYSKAHIESFKRPQELEKKLVCLLSRIENHQDNPISIE
jgi:hypothetical protein